MKTVNVTINKDATNVSEVFGLTDARVDEITEEVFNLIKDNVKESPTKTVTMIHEMYDNEEYVLAFVKFGLNLIEGLEEGISNYD